MPINHLTKSDTCLHISFITDIFRVPFTVWSMFFFCLRHVNIQAALCKLDEQSTKNRHANSCVVSEGWSARGVCTWSLKPYQREATLLQIKTNRNRENMRLRCPQTMPPAQVAVHSSNKKYFGWLFACFNKWMISPIIQISIIFLEMKNTILQCLPSSLNHAAKKNLKKTHNGLVDRGTTTINYRHSKIMLFWLLKLICRLNIFIVCLSLV